MHCFLFCVCFVCFKNASLDLLNWFHDVSNLGSDFASPSSSGWAPRGQSRRASSGAIHWVCSLGTGLSSGQSYCPVTGHDVHSLGFHKPGKFQYKNWRTSTALPARGANKVGRTWFHRHDNSWLIFATTLNGLHESWRRETIIPI